MNVLDNNRTMQKTEVLPLLFRASTCLGLNFQGLIEVLLGDDASANEFYDQAMSLELVKSLCA